MADGTFPGLISKNRDLNAVDNVIYVNLSDGASALGVTGGALDVNLTNASIPITTASGQTITVDGTVNIGNTVTVQATDLDIRDLSHTTDSIALGDGTDLLDINADGSINITDNGGSITVDGTVNIGNTVTVQATDLDIRDLSASQDNVAISDGTDTLAVNADGSINVNVTQSATLSDEFHDYDQAVAVAGGGGTSNHDYTVVNTTAILTGVLIAASGDAKFEVQIDNGGGFATVAVGFTTGKQGDSKIIPFPTPVEATTAIRVIKTNLANQAQDLYSTIMGRDV